MTLKKSRVILMCTFSEFMEDNVLRLSAALAYYAIFSIGPLLLIAVGLAGLAFGNDTVRGEIQQQLQTTFGQNSARIVESMMAARNHSAGLLTTVAGLVALFLGAGGVFGQLQDSLNTIWEVKPKPGAGVWGFIRKRFISYAMVLGVGFLLLVSLALTTFLTAVTGSIGRRLPVPEVLAHFLNFIVSFCVISALFATIFKYLPDVKITFRKVWVGAVGTAFLFTIGKYLLALYLGRASTASYYGAAGSVLIILLWVYYASVILFFGAEFTQVYASQTGRKPPPTKYAVPVTNEDRAQQGISKATASPPASLSRPSHNAAAPLAQSSLPHTILSRDVSWGFMELTLAIGFAGGLLLGFLPRCWGPSQDRS